MLEAAKTLGITREKASSEEALKHLKKFWSKNGVRGKSFVDFETALSRLGVRMRRQRRQRARSRV